MMSTTLQLSDGTSVAVREAGAGAPVLLLHGVGMQAAAWGPQMAALSREHRVIAVDLPGHGGSDLLRGAVSLTAYVDWAARVIGALGLPQVAVAGHSMGALIALGLAVEHPARVSRVALLNCVCRREAAAKAAVLARASEIKREKGDPTATLDRWFDAADGAVRADVAHWLEAVPHEGYAQAYQVFAQSDAIYADRIGEIRCPALFLTGDGDPNSTPAMSRRMAALTPAGSAVVIEGHRHMVNLTAPDQVTAALQGWLEAEVRAA